MWRKQGGLTIVCICFIVSLMFLEFTQNPVLVLAQEGIEEKKVIRVGYMDYAGFIEQRQDGTYIGYGADYLKEICNYTGWEIEYVFDTWDQCLKKLQRGEIDLLCTAQYTEERGKIFEYSKYPIGNETSTLYTRMENEDIFYNDYQGFQGIRIAILKESFQNQLIQNYANLHNFDFTTVEYGSDTECLEALEKGEVDALLTGSLSKHKELKRIAEFDAEPFYLITYKGNTDFISQINEILSQIMIEKPTFQADLYSTYYGKNIEEEEPLFTREEVDYIKSEPIITVGILANNKPISDYNEKTNEFAGITIDILKVIEKKSGLHFKLVEIPATDEPIDYLKEKNINLAAGITNTQKYQEDKNIIISKPYLINDMVMLAKNGLAYQISNDYTIAVPKGLQACKDYIERYHSNYKIIEKTGSKECMNAILNEEADLMIQNPYIISYQLQNPIFDGLSIIYTNTIKENLCMVGDINENPNLIPIINKTIEKLDANALEQIIANHTIANPYRYTLKDMLYKYRFGFCLILGMIFVLIAVYLYILAQRKRYIGELEKKNEQLLEAMAQAEQASRAKGDFLSRMSHEIRTPMNAIVGFTKIASQNLKREEKVKECLDKITIASMLLLNIINDVLDMSAIESQKMKIAYEKFDFKQLILSISNIYYPQCKQKGIHFEIKMNQVTEEYLIGDQLRLNQILLNLLSNAVKFTQKDGLIEVIITQVQEKDSTIFFRFEVHDTGCGMTSEMMTRLFKPFEQEDGSTARTYGGSGLGLSITKNLVDLMKGAIRVTSKKGEGSTFIIELPFGKVLEKEDIKIKFDDIYALIIDADNSSGEYTSSVLNRLSVKHDYVQSDIQAYDKIKKMNELGYEYNIYFMDCIMSEENAANLIQQVRKVTKGPVIIAILSYDAQETEERANRIGADLFIAKPLFQSTIFNLFLNVTGKEFLTRKEGTTSVKTYDFSGYSLLLVEDTKMNLEIAIELLKDTNVKIDIAENGEEAVDKFVNSSEGMYQMILMDVQMPIMDGYEATRLIRKSNHIQAKTIPIIAMTADAFTEDISKALSAGMNAHIAKPIDEVLLYQTIYQYLMK